MTDQDNTNASIGDKDKRAVKRTADSTRQEQEQQQVGSPAAKLPADSNTGPAAKRARKGEHPEASQTSEVSFNRPDNVEQQDKRTVPESSENSGSVGDMPVDSVAQNKLELEGQEAAATSRLQALLNTPAEQTAAPPAPQTTQQPDNSRQVAALQKQLVGSLANAPIGAPRIGLAGPVVSTSARQDSFARGNSAVYGTSDKHKYPTLRAWASLISQYPQVPTLYLGGGTFSVYFDGIANLAFKSAAGTEKELCRIQVEQTSGKPQVATLQCLSSMGVAVNSRPLRLSEKVQLKGGDDITFDLQVLAAPARPMPHVYVFNPLDYANFKEAVAPPRGAAASQGHELPHFLAARLASAGGFGVGARRALTPSPSAVPAARKGALTRFVGDQEDCVGQSGEHVAPGPSQGPGLRSAAADAEGECEVSQTCAGSVSVHPEVMDAPEQVVERLASSLAQQAIAAVTGQGSNMAVAAPSKRPPRPSALLTTPLDPTDMCRATDKLAQPSLHQSSMSRPTGPVDYQAVQQQALATLIAGLQATIVPPIQATTPSQVQQQTLQPATSTAPVVQDAHISRSPRDEPCAHQTANQLPVPGPGTGTVPSTSAPLATTAEGPALAAVLHVADADVDMADQLPQPREVPDAGAAGTAENDIPQEEVAGPAKTTASSQMAQMGPYAPAITHTVAVDSPSPAHMGIVPLPAPSADTDAFGRQVKQYKEELRAKHLRNHAQLEHRFENFAYHLGQGTKERLLATFQLHLEHAKWAHITAELASCSPRVLLSGPYGSQILQEALTQALCRACKANLLVYDKASLGLEVDVPSVAEAADDVKEPVELPGPSPVDDSDDEYDTRELDPDKVADKWRASMAARRRMGREVPPWASKDRASDKDKKDKARVFKKGDRVRFTAASGGTGPPMGIMLGLSGPTAMHSYLAVPGGFLPGRPPPRDSAAVGAPAGGHRGPWAGCTGRVILTFDDNPRKVGVKFDYPIPGGTNLGNLCEDGTGAFCSSSDLRLEGSGRDEEAESAALAALFELANEEAQKAPVVVLVKDADKALLGHMERYTEVKSHLEKLEGNLPLVVVASQSVDAKPSLRERAAGRGGPGGFGFEALFDTFSRWDERAGRGAEAAKILKLLAKLFPNRIQLHGPPSESAAADWRALLERDAATIREQANRRGLSRLLARCSVECPDLGTVSVRDQALTGDTLEKVVGWAVAACLRRHAASNAAAEVNNGRLVIRAADIVAAVETLTAVQAEGQPASKISLKDVVCDNDFERRLLAEVVPADEVGVSFKDIGALDSVKDTLREVVMLPLQRPELFARGSLTKPTKGVLLFGPPGTGKTMLAKAVASECGANFLYVSMATLASKWFGEGEKFVKALFTLAHKISPSVIFVDEVDSLLGRRDKQGEHEAMRKMKNEFMAAWDGLRTRERDRVLVLAATNRPMDLDEAVIRRMPRRIMVDLPDAANRTKILEVILRDEQVEAGFNHADLAALTDGYSGSDLKALCVAAAYRPIREFLAAERSQQAKKPADAGAHSTSSPPAQSSPLDATTVLHPAQCALGENAVVDGTEPGSAAAGTGSKHDVAMQSAAGSQLQGTVTAPAIVCRAGSAHAAPPALRPLSLSDFKEAMKQVGPSVSNDAATTSEMRQWNEMYGEGGTRRAQSLSYFL